MKLLFGLPSASQQLALSKSPSTSQSHTSDISSAAPKSVCRTTLSLPSEKAFSGVHYAPGRRYLCEHAKKEYHLTAVIKSKEFLATLSTGTIVDRISNASQRLLKSKKDYLEGFAMVVHLLGKQNIYWRTP